jgi:WD40 repeat protein
MLRFFAFLVLLAAIVGGIVWVLDPTILGLPPHATEKNKQQVPAARITVSEKDALKLGAEGGNAEAVHGTFGQTLREPIMIDSARLTPSADQEVSSQFERTIREIYVQPGQEVRAGQVVVQLDDSVAQNEVIARRLDWENKTKIAIDSAKAEYDVTKSIAARSQELFEKKAISKQEYEIDVFRAVRAEKEWLKAIEEHKLAKAVYDKAVREMELHKLVSEVNGRVEKVNKKKGETARVGEPVVTIVSTDRLWVEGSVEQQYVRLLRPGMRIQVLPERANPPEKQLREHTEPITGLAISPDSELLASSSKDGRVVLWDWRRKELAIWNSRASRADVDFESVAFSPVVTGGSAGERVYRLLAGCSDGTAQYWTLTVKPGPRGYLEVDPAQTKQVELKNEPGHTLAVTAVAITPNGQFCVTGGEDRQICLWQLQGGAPKFLYTLRAETNEHETAHRGTVTSLCFTPDGRLISAAADRTLKKWRLGDKAAQLENEIIGRSGEVRQITISQDGKLALFDHEEELRILNLSDFRTQSVLAARQLGHFKNIACFSPQADMILTTTTNGRLQLWSTPERPEVEAIYRYAYFHGITKNNFHILGLLNAAVNPLPQCLLESMTWGLTAVPQEVKIGSQPTAKLFLGVPELWNLGGQPFRQLQTPEATTETCGVFAPNVPYFFTGGTDKVIRVWAKPTPEEGREAMEAVITFVGNQVEGGLVRIRAEMDNPSDNAYRLPVGTKVNMRAYPESDRFAREMLTPGKLVKSNAPTQGTNSADSFAPEMRGD